MGHVGLGAWAGRVAGGARELEGGAGSGARRRRGAPGGKGRGALVKAANGRGHERRPGTAEEAHPHVCERQLGVFGEGRAQLAGDRVGLDPAGELGHGAGLWVVDREVDGEQRAEGVLEGLCHVDRAVKGRGDGVAFGVADDFVGFVVLGEQRRCDFHRADLGRRRAALGRL